MLGYDAILINRLIIKYFPASNPTYDYDFIQEFILDNLSEIEKIIILAKATLR